MPFEEMDPELLRELLAGQRDILTPMAENRDRIYRNLVCPCCGKQEWTIINKGQREDELIPWHHFLCENCGCLYDPKTDLVLKDGNPSTSLVNPEIE